MKCIITLIITMFFIYSYLLAQKPFDDASWKLVLHDSFDSLNTDYWCTYYCWAGIPTNVGRVNNGAEYNLGSNVVFNNEIVTLN